MMLFCRLRALKRRQAIWILLSILTQLGATDVTGGIPTNPFTTVIPLPDTTDQSIKATSSISTQSPVTEKAQIGTTVLAHTSTPQQTQTKDVETQSLPLTTSNTSSVIADAKATIITTSKTTSKPLQSSTVISDLTSLTPTTQAFNQLNSNELNSNYSSSQEANSTTSTVPPYNTTEVSENANIISTRKIEETSNTQSTEMPLLLTCHNLRSQVSTSEVLCMEYKEKVKCENLREDQKDSLKNILCNITSDNSTCHLTHLTLYSSEVNPNCLLWIPASMATSEDKSKSERQELEPGIKLKWGQVSEHQTKSQKTMIALVTSGVLLAALVLAGYLMSNRESWSPGRQRLGEDPYYTETDSQGNTLVSVSAHGQEKTNSGSRENGKGQSVNSNATNGHSAKTKAISDTEL